MAADDYHKNEFIFKTITAFRLVIGVALTLAVLFAMVWLIDYSSDRPAATYNQQTLLLHDSGEDEKAQQPSSFFKRLLNKKEKKAAGVVDSVNNTSDTISDVGANKRSFSAKKADAMPVVRSTEPSVARTRPQPSQSTPRPALPPSLSEAVFTVQLGSFQQTERAKIFSEDLAAKGYQPYIAESAMPNGTTTYRVRIGRFAAREEAMELASRIERVEKISVFVTSK